MYLETRIDTAVKTNSNGKHGDCSGWVAACVRRYEEAYRWTILTCTIKQFLVKYAIFKIYIFDCHDLNGKIEHSLSGATYIYLHSGH